MLVADLAQFLLLWILASLIVRYTQGKLNKESQTGKAIAYLFH